MKLTFLYAPVDELGPALAFYRDALGWREAWREGDTTVAFHLPGSDVQVMVSESSSDVPGPMYLVQDARAFAAHAGLSPAGAAEEIPGGVVLPFDDPAGNRFYVFDQATG